MNNFLQNPVNSEQEKQILFYHKIFYFAQSTAFIVPIFYIYIQEKTGYKLRSNFTNFSTL